MRLVRKTPASWTQTLERASKISDSYSQLAAVLPKLLVIPYRKYLKLFEFNNGTYWSHT
jgi:hypothetical protein